MVITTKIVSKADTALRNSIPAETPKNLKNKSALNKNAAIAALFLFALLGGLIYLQREITPPIPAPRTLSQASGNVPPQSERASFKVDDVIQFGRYSWRVLDIRDGKVMILSDMIIERRAYTERDEAVTWETCTLRQYLNGEFYDKFSEAEKAMIAETRIPNDNNQWLNTSGGNATNDKIFLLSIEEVVKYFGDSGDLKNRKGLYYDRNWVLFKDGKGAISDQYNSARLALDTDCAASWWWLRSPGGSSEFAASVRADGKVDLKGSHVRFGGGGLRPALWLNL